MKFVLLPTFEKSIAKAKISEADVDRLIATLSKNPDDGDAIQGLPGARKSRFAIGKSGKSGGGRAIYVFVRVRDTILLILAFSKRDQTDLSPSQRKLIAEALAKLK